MLERLKYLIFSDILSVLYAVLSKYVIGTDVAYMLGESRELKRGAIEGTDARKGLRNRIG